VVGFRSDDPPLIASVDMHRHAGRRVRMRGLAISYKRVPTKAGGWMKFLSLEDLAGTFEAVLFPEAYARYAETALGAGPFALEGRVEVDQGVPSLTVTGLVPLRDDRREGARAPVPPAPLSQKAGKSDGGEGGV
jgi:DNA polymerase III alpha subunit